MIPRLRHAQVGPSFFDLRSSVVHVKSTTEGADAVATVLKDDLRRVGVKLAEQESATSAVVTLDLGAGDGGPEDYRIEVGDGQVQIRAAQAAGLFYGTRTVVAAAGSVGKLSHGVIEDGPRYKWRGAHLDVARHFFSIEAVKRFIDLIALHKMNVFHWHLTEDQGWRIQIDGFPRLTEVAAFRSVGSQRYGGFYTKSEIREVVSYAAVRHVTVVPEIEMPGHAVAALAAYPELSCSGGPFRVETEWGIFDDVYCVGNDKTLEFLERVLDEVIELFPSEFFHIGADECPKLRWKSCPRCQARMEKEGLKTEEELQSWFVCRMSDYLSARGKRLVGWDEILEGGLAPGATVMSWRGTKGGIRAAQMGHDVVMTPTTHCYLDYKQTASDSEPGAWFAPDLDLETVYSYEPTPRELTPQQAAHVLGVQANIWTENMPTFKQVEYMAFPRLCALSEVGWSGPERDFQDFSERLKAHLTLLDRLEVGYRGSRIAQPVVPTELDRERYLAAKRDRERRQPVAAY